MIHFFLLFLLGIASFVQAEQLPKLLIERDQSFKAISGLRIPNLDEICEDLEYPNGVTPQAFRYDLNGDKAYEILIQSYRTLCGTGGCEYILIDGKSKRKIGNFMGSSLAVQQKKEGQQFPDIKTYTYMGSGEGILETFTYSNGKYRSQSLVNLSARESVNYLNKQEKVPTATSK